ncbi:hypothetical protein QVD17_08718 [Tagetes erecta]|uniref:Uncharacterized protein n=1 Tax=Tagetes erecta TaxID=13708 RepID=A0AAD8L322_TARER|nr:hypothetical protein QVD17_08718 [Tagetes erecta]
MTKELENEKIAHVATQVDLTKMNSSKAILAKLVSERKDNKAGLGFTHEPLPKSITNTLPENFNQFDHSPENEENFKEIQRIKSESRSTEEKGDEKVLTKNVKEEVVEYQELISETPKTVKNDGEFLGFNDPEYLKWKKE